jgi:hypothetical protein
LVIPSPSSPVHRALICLHILTQAKQYQQHCLSSINIITSISFSLHRGQVSGVSDRYSTVIPLRSSTHSSRPFRFHHKKHKLVCSHNSNKIAKHNTQFSQSLYLSDIGPYQGRGTGEYCWQLSFERISHLICGTGGGGRNNNVPRWTMDQSRSVHGALIDHKTTLKSLVANLEMCRPEAIVLFGECIRFITSLNSLHVQYHSNHSARGASCDAVDLQRIYHEVFDNIFRAVLQNPFTNKLDTTCLGSDPESIFELLFKTSSLQDLRI